MDKNRNRRRNPLFDRFFGMDGMNPFGNPFSFEEYMQESFNNYEDLEEEKFEVMKGKYKTVLICKFNKEGFMVSHYITSEYIPTDTEKSINELELEKKEAIEAENYIKASEIQKQIQGLQTNIK